MVSTVFSKKRHTQEGKTFYTFLGRLKKKDGTEQVVAIKFRDECGSPKPEKCPVNIVFDKKDANMSVTDFVRDDGETGKSYTLWVSAWAYGEAYVDHSLDDFE